MPSQHSRGGRKKVASSRSCHSSSSAGYFPCQEEDVAFDVEVDPLRGPVNPLLISP
jgi:hypothetical protein